MGGAQVRKSAARRERGGARRQALSSPDLGTPYWVLGGRGAVAAGRRALPQGELDLPRHREPAERGGPCGRRDRLQGEGPVSQPIAEERGPPCVGVGSPAPWAARVVEDEGAWRTVGRRGWGRAWAAIPTPTTSRRAGLASG